MTDWKQITARIRRARGSKNPAEQLSNLFQKTRDAMVAFELARHLEGAGQNSDAAKWYATAAERFRRADWKTKAQEAVTRLGGQLPAEDEQAMSSAIGEEHSIAAPPAVIPEPGIPFEQSAETFESIVSSPNAEVEATDAPTAPAAESAAPGSRPRHRRGRRGGRNRRKPGTSSSPSRENIPDHPQQSRREADVDETTSEAQRTPMLRLPLESAAEAAGPGLRGRYGDPGLSSRLSLLEMQFRRLLQCPPAKPDRADTAPAGPGVFVLTDEEMTSYYYVESCDTLRVAIANLVRGGANRRGAPSIKPLLADFLGIPEARVSKYLADHCVVRWLQLDEGAQHFAHFAIAVLRPALNE
jgi:hypothetical protein